MRFFSGAESVLRRPFDVFLCHNSQDKPAVRELASALSELGIKAWLDEVEIPPGRFFHDALEDVLPKVKTAAILIGRNGIGKWQNMERRVLTSRCIVEGIPVIPILLPGLPTGYELPPFLKELNWVDMRGGLSDEALQRLRWGISGKKGSPRPPSAVRKRPRVNGTREVEYLGFPSLGTQSEFHSVSFDRLPDPIGRWQRVDEILAGWDPGRNREKPLVFILHFAADARETLLTVRSVLAEQQAAALHSVQRIQWLRGAAVVRLDNRRREDITQADGPKGLLLAGSGDRRSDGAVSVSQELTRSCTPPTLFLVDFSEIPVDFDSPAVSGVEAPGLASALTSSLADLCSWAGENDHVVIVALPRHLLCLPGLFRDAESYMAVELFSRFHTGRGEDCRRILGEIPLPRALEALLYVNSNALVREVADWVRGAVSSPGWAAEAVRDSPPRALLPLAARLSAAGFHEAAYRLELDFCAKEATVGFIPLEAEVVQERTCGSRLKAHVENAEDLPKFIPRATLTGESGAGKSTTLAQIEAAWALPRWSDRGRKHPAWLPVSVRFGSSQAGDPTAALRCGFARHAAEVGVDLPGHVFFAEHATPENVRRLLSSPLLFLVDDAEEAAAGRMSRVEATLAALLKNDPDAGCLVALRRDLPEGTRERWDRVRLLPLNDHQIRDIITPILKSRGLEAGLLGELLDPNDHAIASALRNPLLVSLLGDISNGVEDVSAWNLYTILRAFVDRRAGWGDTSLGGAEPVRYGILESWLPQVALKQMMNRLQPSGPSDPIPQDLLEDAAETGLVRPEAVGGRIVFSHRLLEHFFAARELERRMSDPAFIATFLAGRRAELTEWQDVFRILVGSLERHAADGFIAALSALNAPRIAQRCLLERKATEAKQFASTAPTLDALVRLIGDARQAGPPDLGVLARAISDSDALGYLDPRICVESPLDGFVAFEPHGDPLRLKIGKYPVTNMEYSRFITDGGYDRQEVRWWAPHALRWLEQNNIRHPLHWHCEQLNKPNYPVVGVSGRLRGRPAFMRCSYPPDAPERPRAVPSSSACRQPNSGQAPPA